MDTANRGAAEDLMVIGGFQEGWFDIGKGREQCPFSPFSPKGSLLSFPVWWPLMGGKFGDHYHGAMKRKLPTFVEILKGVMKFSAY